MKGIILYSSVTGNTKKLATEIYNNINIRGEWSLHNIKDDKIDINKADVVLIGGWCEGGTLNKATLNFMDNVDLSNKKVGIFMTMGSRVETEHGNLCASNLQKLVDRYDSLGSQILQGEISPLLMDKLSNMPEGAIPESVKTAMIDGIDTYKKPSEAEYSRISSFFANQL